MAPPVKCNECGRIFGTLAGLEQHAKDKAHRHAPSYFCPLETCDERFESRKKRDKHVYSMKHNLQPEKSSSSEAEEEDRVPENEGSTSRLTQSSTSRTPSLAMTGIGQPRQVCSDDHGPLL